MRKGQTVTKHQHRETLLNYLGNPANEFPTRQFMSEQVLGFAKNTQFIYKMFTLEELAEIETEALALRRTKYSPGLAKVDRALILKALEGSEAAIKLCYQRFEDWGERKELSGPAGKDLNWTIEIVDSEVEQK